MPIQGHQSSIDFILIRKEHALPTTKHCRAQWEHALRDPTIEHGHTILECEISRHFKQQTQHPYPCAHSNTLDRERYIQAPMAERERWQTYYTETQVGLQQLWSRWRAARDRDIWQSMNEYLTSQAAKYFPRALPHHAPPRWATPEYATLRQERGMCWMQIYSLRHTLAEPSSCMMFRWWRLLTRHQRLTRQMRGLAQQLRAEHLDQHITQAAEAAQQGNSRVYWSLIKRVAPKTKRPLATLRNAETKVPLDKQESDRVHAAHLQTVFWRQDATPWQSDQSDHHVHSYHITESQLMHALQRLPLRKSAPPHLPAASVCRAHASDLASYLGEYIEHFWHTEHDP